MREHRPRLACLLLLAAAPAFGWGDAGHQAIAAVAERFLEPAVRARALAILATDDSGLVERDLAHEANWADRWRDSDRLLLRRRYDATRQWHFVDLELDDHRPDPERLADACFGRVPLAPDLAAAQGPAASCLVDKIVQFRAELASPATAPAERLRALQFLLHFVGEIHQPLHAADAHDAGGHDLKLSAEGFDCEELHACWDTDFVRALAADGAALQHRLRAALGNDARPALAGSPDDWALESFALARDEVYGRLPAARAGEPVRLDAAYVANAERIVEGQLGRAALRLAAVLNADLARSQP